MHKTSLKYIKVSNMILLTLAGIVNAIGITMFLYPVKLYDGGISGKKMTMVYFIVNRFQITNMKDIVHEIAPHAYISINEVADVFYHEGE